MSWRKSPAPGWLWLMALMAAASPLHASEEPLYLVREGRPAGAVIVAADADDATRQVATYFIRTVQRSTGATLPLITEADADSLAADAGRLYLGATDRAKQAGLVAADLEPESYRLIFSGNAAMILGRDAAIPALGEWNRWRRDASPWPTRWAVNHILEEHLGVRWLWPGELGTYVPRHNQLAIPRREVAYQPTLVIRGFGVGGSGSRGALTPGEDRMAREAFEWVVNHEGSSRHAALTGRPNLSFNHAFNDWFDRFGKEHPDWFIPIPEGMHPLPSHHMKLRFAHPEVIEQIAREYQAAGAPDYWCVSENDGNGFDTSPEMRAWDIPTDLAIEDIWFARANLTPRYVKIWNTLYERLSQINPDVTLVAMAYHAYLEPPPAQRPLTARMVVAMVPGYRGQAYYDHWAGWRSAPGNQGMILRPNWGHVGAGAPYLPLEDMHRFMTFARRNGMIGFRLDSLIGHWATQGPNHYLIARLLNRPELSKDQILTEYTSAFGAGAPQIRAYLDYWQKVGRDIGFNDVSFTRFTPDPEGRYAQLLEEGNVSSRQFYRGARQAAAFLYTDAVLEPGYALLAEAETRIGTSDAEALARVAFLRHGLDELKLARDQVAFYEAMRKTQPPTDEQLQDYRRIVANLDKLRAQASAHHAVWGHRLFLMEQQRKYPPRPEGMEQPATGDDWGEVDWR